MARIPFSGLLAAVLIFGSCNAGVADEEAPSPELKEWYAQAAAAMESHAHHLAARGDGRSKLAAVHLLVFPAQPAQGGGPDEALVALRDQWFSEAVAQSSEDPLLAWIHAACSVLITRESCERNRDVGLDRLAEVAGDRAVTHLMLAQRAGTNGDVESERAHFYAAAAAERFGSFDQEHMEVIVGAFENLELPPTTDRERTALAELLDTQSDLTPRQIVALFSASSLYGITLPAFQYPMHQCGLSGDTRERSERRHQACLQLFERMASDSHNVLQDTIAAIAMVELSGDGNDAHQWRERLRAVTWSMEQYREAASTGRFDNAEYVEEWMAHGEREAMRRRLVELDVADTPPAGWLPDNAERRNLIEHGHRQPR